MILHDITSELRLAQIFNIGFVETSKFIRDLLFKLEIVIIIKLNLATLFLHKYINYKQYINVFME